MAEFHVDGLAELEQFLDKLPKNIIEKVMRGGLRAGQVVILRDAKDRCPVEEPSDYARKWGAYPGALRDSLRVGTPRVTADGNVVSRLTAGNKKAFYARWVEFGTKPHMIRARNGGALAIGGGAYKSVQHPGARPYPFFRTAVDLQSHAATQRVAEYLAGRVTKEIGKLPDESNT